MERLTKERLGDLNGEKFVRCNNADNSDCNDFCRYGICRWNEKAQMRLHEYENTGLAPKDVNSAKLLAIKYLQEGIKYNEDAMSSAIGLGIDVSNIVKANDDLREILIRLNSSTCKSN